MKRIVFVIEQLYGGGAERVTAALINELCKTNEVHLVSTYIHDEIETYPVDPRVIKHAPEKLPKSRMMTYLKRILFLRETISGINPFCVVSLAATGTKALVIAAMMGKHVPVILSERNDPRRTDKAIIFRLLRSWSYHMSDGVVFQTKEAQSFFAPSIRRKSAVICNPINSELPFRYEGERELRIINCCRLVSQKNLNLLIDAFSDIANEFPNMSLEVWGEGPERCRLEERIENMGMQDRIRLPGFSENIYSIMRPCSLFVMSSDYEGISNSMLEAMALGVPTISTDCPAGGARETIQDGVNGLLVPVGDRAALANAMRRVLSEPELAEKLSINGYRIREDISTGVIAQRWYDFIGKIAG